VIDPTTPTETIELLTAEANTKHGDPTPVSWRLQQAKYLTNLGHPIDVVSNALGLSNAQLLSAQRAEKADIRAERLSISGWTDLANGNKVVLMGLPLDTVFKAAALTVIQTAWGAGSPVRDFVKQIKGKGSETEMMDYIGEVHQQRMLDMKARAATGKKSPIHNYKTTIVTALGSVLALDPVQVPRYFLTDAEREEISTRLCKAAEHLLNIDTMISKADDDGAS
jgi:hypothetical protein